jgi:AraC-like DNA-binding protein
MKVVQFTIPVSRDNTVVAQHEVMPHFYNYLHRHNEVQLTWIIEGNGTLIAGNYMQAFHSGDIYIIGSNQPHILKSDPSYFDKKSKKTVTVLTIFFNPVGPLKNLLLLPEMDAANKFVQAMHTGMQVPIQQQAEIAAAMQLVHDNKQANRISSFIDLLHRLSEINDIKILSTIRTDHHFTEQEGLRMNDVYQYTMDNYTEDINLKKVASIAHLTPQAFCRYFKKHTRRTYITFLNEIRVNAASKKLIAGNFDSIAALAFEAGFSSIVSFNRVFKKTTGMSPRQYQKEYAQKTG